MRLCNPTNPPLRLNDRKHSGVVWCVCPPEKVGASNRMMGARLSAFRARAVATIACVAWDRRRAALVCGLLYSASLCFVHNGHAQILGPVGCGAAISGILRPRNPGCGTPVRPR